LQASALAAVYIGMRGSDGAGGGSGREVETRLAYAPERLPLYGALGYRFEQFTVDDATETRAEEISGVVAILGIRLRR
jgi:hypothetical protein